MQKILLPYLFSLLVLFCDAQTSPSKVTSFKKQTVSSLLSCNNWLATSSQPSAMNIGDLDISGNQITVEAVINRTTPYSGGNPYAGDVVSKHQGPSDVNYLLRPNSAEITTTNGYFITPPICGIELNKTYHVAMVYNGSVLKFYRDGYLMSQVNATGNLFQNNFNTRIGYYDLQLVNTQFVGFINEVRIWNVARTQAQIQSTMNSSLPSPATQPGLQAYYTFDDLLNKQGNTAWNGTLNGAATINQTNPNCSFVADSCTQLLSCNNWLKLPSYPSSVSVGDLDVTGNHLTVEASFNSTTALNPALQFGKLVSKHTGPSDVNYSLMGITCEITTTNGYVNTPVPCMPVNDKLYHVAMVYDGSVLKFYRNGYLLSSIPWSGNLINNNWLTTIGSGPNNPGAAYQQLGYINEVRIWNIARTQAQIQAYMNSSLPNPTTQTGLLGYYTFDDLVNKQGNVTFNGTLNGSATINAVNPNCSFNPDSCFALTPISNIINQYTPVLAFDPCKNILTVGDATNYNAGDTVLLIQMKGAVIDSTNTANFGTVTNYKNAGNYEFNYVQSKSGNNIVLKNVLTRNYDIPFGKVQLVRVPYYQNANVTATLTCKPWDGGSGGIVVLTARDSVTLNANIDVSGNGFKGGQVINTGLNSTTCFTNNYFYPNGTTIAAPKGESIVNVGTTLTSGKGTAASGGGGGLDHNSGGGGGGNGGQGGFGGYEYDGCGNNPFDNRGIGGRTLSYSPAANKIFLGAGGGAGHCNQAAGINLNGGNGGGIVMVQTPKLISNGNSIISNGLKAIECTNSDPNICNDGSGGGGAGGTVLLSINAYTATTPVLTKGGAGANMYTNLNQGRVGPGGGGGGGVTWVSQATMPTAVTTTSTGGANGVILLDANNPYGTTAGQPGTNAFNFSIPVDNTPFKINIDSKI